MLSTPPPAYYLHHPLAHAVIGFLALLALLALYFGLQYLSIDRKLRETLYRLGEGDARSRKLQDAEAHLREIAHLAARGGHGHSHILSVAERALRRIRDEESRSGDPSERSTQPPQEGANS